MEIGLTYSSKDPRQARTRDFVKSFIRERGILARFIESEQPVQVPTITVNGCPVTDYSGPDKSNKHRSRFPTRQDIAHALEKSIWCL